MGSIPVDRDKCPYGIAKVSNAILTAYRELHEGRDARFRNTLTGRAQAVI